MPFWWACWTAWQTGTNSSSRCRRRQAVLVAVVGDRHALDQLHHEVRPAASRRAGVEDLGDVGVVHQGQRLPLRLEAGEDLARVHAGLDDLDGDQALDRLGLLGQPDGAHAALADLLQAACTGRSPCRGPRPRARAPVADQSPRRGRQEGAGSPARRCRHAVRSMRRARQATGRSPQAARQDGLASGRRRVSPASRQCARTQLRRRSRSRGHGCAPRRAAHSRGAVAGRFARPPRIPSRSAAQPGAGVGPVAVGGRAGRCPRPGAASSIVSPAKKRSLTSSAAVRVVPASLVRASSRASRSVRGLGPASSTSVRS